MAASNRSLHGASLPQGSSGAASRSSSGTSTAWLSAASTSAARVVLVGDFALQLQQAVGGQRKAGVQQASGHQPHRLVSARGQARRRRNASPFAADPKPRGRLLSAARIAISARAIWLSGILHQEGGGRGSRGVVLVGDPQQHALRRQQARPIAARLLRHEVIDVLQASQILLAVDHAVDLLQFRKEIAAAELDFLARAAGTKRICVDGHEGVESG